MLTPLFATRDDPSHSGIVLLLACGGPDAINKSPSKSQGNMSEAWWSPHVEECGVSEPCL